MFKKLFSEPKKLFLIMLGVFLLGVGIYYYLREMGKRSKAAPGVPALSYSVEPTELQPGQNFDLIMKVNPNGASFFAFELYTNFDASRVSFQNTANLAENITSPYILVTSSVDTGNSKITVIGTRTGSAFTGNSEIEIARVKMKVASGASGDINFNWDANTKLGSNINKETLNGVFTIGGGGGEQVPVGPDLHINIPSIQSFPGQTAEAAQGSNIDTQVYLKTDGNDVKSVDFILPYDDSKLTFQNTTDLTQNIVISPSSGFNTQFVIKKVDTVAKKISIALAAQLVNSVPVPVNNVNDILIATIKFKVRPDAPEGLVSLLPDTGSTIYNMQTQNIISCTGGFRFNVIAAGSPTSTPIPNQPTDTPAPGEPTNTPIPGEPTETPVPGEPTSTPFVPDPTDTPIITRDPDTVAMALNLKLRFQGITTTPNRLTTIPVKISLIRNNASADSIKSQTVNFSVDQSGIWSGQAYFQNMLVASDYKILIKGPMHLQKRICQAGPSEAEPGKYSCITGTIPLVAGTNTLDFSSVNLVSGDLPPQDGIANAFDVALVRNNLGSTDGTILAQADVNFDGIVDTQDYSLVIEALFVRTDDER